MIVQELEDWHLQRLSLQRAQASMGPAIDDWQYRQSLLSFEGYAGLHDGVPVVAAGAIPQGTQRALVWALLAGKVPMVAVHRAVKRWLDLCEIRRLETWVASDHQEGVRWAELLGFEREGLMRKFLPDGGDAWLYARVL